MSQSQPSASSADLLLLVDVGNTNLELGVVDDGELGLTFRLSTEIRTADEWAGTLLPLFARAGLDPESVGSMVVSSVVPPLHFPLQNLARRYFDCEPLFVEPGVRTGLPIAIDNPTEVGADRVVNAVAARHLYGAPVVVVDFGTATTFDIVNSAGEYAGGLIAPGIGISAEALFSHASRLSRVDIRRPDRLIGRSTVGAMQSGIYYGYIGLVDGILQRLRREVDGLERVVATGGLAPLIAAGSQHINTVNGQLTLIGLQQIHQLNR